MLVEERRQKVLELVQQRGFVASAELVRVLGVSESTLRRDLEYWDQLGNLKRTHGGAMYTGQRLEMPALEDRSTTALPQKRAIAEHVAGQLADGSAILLDGGTTTLEIARLIIGRSLQVVTNSLPIAQLLSGSGTIDLILLGGYVSPRTGVAMGPLTIKQLEGIQVQTAYFGVSGITPKGLFNSNLLLVETERAMMRTADEVVVVADASKLGRSALAPLCELHQVRRLITDGTLSSEQRQWLEEAGVLVEVAGVKAA